MKWESVQFLSPSAKGKRLRAVFRSGTKTRTINFGSAGGSTYIDHRDDKIRAAWKARHKVREDWSVPDNAGSLSRWVLWERPTLPEAKRRFAARFGLKLIK